jgi:hypothetical protein
MSSLRRTDGGLLQIELPRRNVETCMHQGITKVSILASDCDDEEIHRESLA